MNYYDTYLNYDIFIGEDGSMKIVHDVSHWTLYHGTPRLRTPSDFMDYARKIIDAAYADARDAAAQYNKFLEFAKRMKEQDDSSTMKVKLKRTIIDWFKEDL